MANDEVVRLLEALYIELREQREIIEELREEVRTMKNELRAIEGVSFHLSKSECEHMGMPFRRTG